MKKTTKNRMLVYLRMLGVFKYCQMYSIQILFCTVIILIALLIYNPDAISAVGSLITAFIAYKAYKSAPAWLLKHRYNLFHDFIKGMVTVNNNLFSHFTQIDENDDDNKAIENILFEDTSFGLIDIDYKFFKNADFMIELIKIDMTENNTEQLSIKYKQYKKDVIRSWAEAYYYKHLPDYEYKYEPKKKEFYIYLRDIVDKTVQS
ncbi:hypothetical protein ACXKU5_002836 [Yersinia enterocolitica]|uniref:Uncharacterized protein n=3 Tax=Yersinia TaxID=629 RepID=A0A0T9TP24_YERAE|nr:MULTISPECIES: hypothetical protein [Yersinia]AKF37308.1 hypothetical protein FORC2_1161 [Yersinia enterocolitica]ALG46097.1 hypothetical protein LI89_15655 [Yersinia enterocolitica]EKN4193803.1 hypothetical protein [Yersinia enterocolitica]EKN6129964.1 hypothetical protein [Yersinia enterocolitica]ELI7899878.1 hypothetical protein [Yersinia enterocolitica]